MQQNKPTKGQQFTEAKLQQLAIMANGLEVAASDIACFARHYVIDFSMGDDPVQMRNGLGRAMTRIDAIINNIANICEEVHDTWTRGALKDETPHSKSGIVVVPGIPKEIKDVLDAQQKSKY